MSEEFHNVPSLLVAMTDELARLRDRIRELENRLEIPGGFPQNTMWVTDNTAAGRATYSTLAQLLSGKVMLLGASGGAGGAGSYDPPSDLYQTLASLFMATGASSVASVQIVPLDWGQGLGILINAYLVGTTGSITAAGNTKYMLDGTANSTRAFLIHFNGNGGGIYIYVSPIATGKGNNCTWTLLASYTLAAGLTGGWYFNQTSNTWGEIGAVGQPAFANSWVNYDTLGTWNTAAYRMLPDGTVELKGLIKSGSFSISSTIFVLPAGYGPADNNLMFSTISYNGSAYVPTRVDVNADTRAVVAVSGANQFLSLDGIRFRSR